MEFFRRVTPIAQIGTLPIASRPVARGMDASTELDDLRAIPWVFAWGQSRVNLTGWYGLGAGLSAVAARRGGLGRLRSMARAWPFFATLLENAELSLAKADPAIADLYLARGDRPDLAAAIREELARTTDLVLAVSGHTQPARREAGPATGDRISQPLRRRSVVPAGAVPGRAGYAADRAAGAGHDQRRGRRPAEHRLSAPSEVRGLPASCSRMWDRRSHHVEHPAPPIGAPS